MSLIVTNTTAAVLDLNDLGIGLDPSSQLDLSLESDAVIIANSAIAGDLNQLITSGDLTLADPNDGVTVLSVADALAALQSHNDSHYRMPVGAKIGDAFDVDVSGAVVGDTLTIDVNNNWVATTHNRWEIIDTDGDTGITAESATGADDDELLFTVSGNRIAEIRNTPQNEILIPPYPNTRDNTAAVPPTNFLYTGPDGSLYSAPVPFRAVAQLPNPVGNNTATFMRALRLSANIPHTGRYRIMWRTVTSLNTAAEDILIRLRRDGVTDIASYRVEHKDSAGAGIVVTNLAGGTFNSGTSQRVPYSDFDIIDVNAGIHNFDLEIAGTVAGIEPTLYAATIIIERWDY